MIRAFLIAAMGVALGLWSAQAVIVRGGPFGTVALGPWRLAWRSGAADADPYTKASMARSGEIPLAAGEGLQLIARVDDDGRKLRGNCVYDIGRRTPAARYWTLGAVDSEGFALVGGAERAVFRSSEVLRAPDGSFDIVAARFAQPGNWLPLGEGVGTFSLVLRLYDTPLSVAGGGLENSEVPSIKVRSCS